MKRLIIAIVSPWVVAAAASAQAGGTAADSQMFANLQQGVSVVGGGNAESSSASMAQGGTSDATSFSVSQAGDSWAASEGGIGLSQVNISSTTNVKGRTAPLGTVPAYLPLWNHGGWGTIKAYFANGPTGDDTVYERIFDPHDPRDVEDVRGVLTDIPHRGPIEWLADVVNGVSVVFGGPDKYHHGRGFEIASSLIRDRRPHSKPMVVFIDSNVDRAVLKKCGYAYVGKVSVEGKETLNFDQVYNAVVAEALPWNVDILLVSGGMKGVTVGSNTSFPNIAGGYSQVNYSLSLTGGVAKGITEAKGKPVMGAEAYRLSRRLTQKRQVPSDFYRRLQAQLARANTPAPARPAVSQSQYRAPMPAPMQAPMAPAPQTHPGVPVSRELLEMVGLQQGQQVITMPH